ncbi:MAG: ATPase [Bacteroidales bacterium]|nr:ATPase [Bacteroidales bacterium]
MKKYSFLLYHKDYENFINKLYEIGVAHIIEKEDFTVINEKLDDKLSLMKKYTSYIKFLKQFAKTREITDLSPAQENISNEALIKYEEIKKHEEAIKHRLATIKKDIVALTPWGDFDFKRIKQLAENGYYINFFTCPERNFLKEWQDEYNALIISESSSQYYFITVTKEKHVNIEADTVKLPNERLSDLYSEQEKLEKDLDKILITTDEYVKEYLLTLEKEAKHNQTDFDFSKVRLETEDIAGDKVKLIECWVPEEKETPLLEALTNGDILYTSREAEVGEKVPILLKNNKIARLFEPIGELYTLPEYGELDLTPFFAPFYMLFFGLCLGDAGYGVLMAVASLFAIKFIPKMKNIFKLTFWLGIATIIFGTISGTFFGIELLNVDWPWMTNLKKIMLDQNQLFYNALIIGVVQILFGMCLKVVNMIKHKNYGGMFSTLGWLTLILGMGGTFLLSSQGIVTAGVAKIMYIVFGAISFVLIFVLNNLKRNVFINVGAGLWDTYNMVTGILGDVLSYIRLFALGICGAVMGFVFNDLAINLSPDIIIVKQIVMIIILLIGHGMNIFMSGLSAFVHPMRLTFVEFYKNAGFTGGGKKYSPFADKNK